MPLNSWMNTITRISLKILVHVSARPSETPGKTITYVPTAGHAHKLLHDVMCKIRIGITRCKVRILCRIGIGLCKTRSGIRCKDRILCKIRLDCARLGLE